MKPSLIIFFVALAVRLIYLLLMIDGAFFGVPYLDEMSFFVWSMDIASGNILGTEVFFRAPLYPYLVAIVFSIMGGDLFVIYLLQFIGGSFGCVLQQHGHETIHDRRVVTWKDHHRTAIDRRSCCRGGKQMLRAGTLH